MSELEALQCFNDELAATRRQLRRLEKLAVSLKRQQREHPRRLGPLFQLRKAQHHLAKCEAILTPVTSAASTAPPTSMPNETSTSVNRTPANVIRLIGRRRDTSDP